MNEKIAGGRFQKEAALSPPVRRLFCVSDA